jgi:regulator of PEP synthase PpsR (kinase-PPPase family)
LRNERQLDHALEEIEANPGIVLYTLVDHTLGEKLETRCREMSVPCLSVLGPVLSLFHGYLGAETTPRVGGQHMLNPAYFRRIEALNFTMMHDDGQHTEDIEDADVVLIGVSRTSKTPTSIYLANRGIKTLNIPLVPEVDPPAELETTKKPLVIGLYASPERIVQIRQNRLLSLNAAQSDSAYIDRERVSQEIAASKKLCAKHGWPSIEVSRRSIEETAAAVIALLQERRRTEQA